MKTFGLFMVLLLLIVVGLSGVSKEWSGPEIIIQSTILAYIMQQYFTEELKNK
jgi:hypothetical protein